MTDTIELVISQILSKNEINSICSKTFGIKFSESEIYITIVKTDDDVWNTLVSIYFTKLFKSLGENPELKLAQQLYELNGINSILGNEQKYINGIDPHNPYYCIVCKNGKWYLGDTSNSKLDTGDGDNDIAYLCELDRAKLILKQYHIEELQNCKQISMQGSEATMINKYDIIKITKVKKEIDKSNLTFCEALPKVGDIATVLEIYDKPTLAFECECSNKDGTTRWLLALSPDDINFERIK